MCEDQLNQKTLYWPARAQLLVVPLRTPHTTTTNKVTKVLAHRPFTRTWSPHVAWVTQHAVRSAGLVRGLQVSTSHLLAPLLGLTMNPTPQSVSVTATVSSPSFAANCREWWIDIQGVSGRAREEACKRDSCG